MQNGFWEGKKVLITGHTGFKGAWLSLWLSDLGASVYGYALAPNTNPSLFEILNLSERISHCVGDIRDMVHLKKRINTVQPEIIIHMAAQPLVRFSYQYPVETYETNVMGTVNLLECVRHCDSVKIVVNVTTDKCYENKEWNWGYRENEPMGGYDPYSNSKGCSELVTAAFRNSYFNPNNYEKHGKSIASARAGNVIGGGDWSQDRLIPDIINSILNKKEIIIRNPNAIRPWQHVLEPLSGYMKLIQKMWDDPTKYASGWNFGPEDHEVRPVSYIANYLSKKLLLEKKWSVHESNDLHEATYLKLDISKARAKLGWKPRLTLDETLDSIVSWYQGYQNQKDIYKETARQIKWFSSKE